jgi:hypothetical protein
MKVRLPNQKTLQWLEENSDRLEGVSDADVARLMRHEGVYSKKTALQDAVRIVTKYRRRK